MRSERKQVVDDRIRALYAEHGTITPDIVIADAKDPASPLHEEFNWDVNAAALAHWQERARALISGVKIITEPDKVISAPEFVRDPAADPHQQGYVSIVSLRNDIDLARDALVAEFSRAAQALSRAYAIAAALNLDNEVKQLHERVQQLQQEIETRVLQ